MPIQINLLRSQSRPDDVIWISPSLDLFKIKYVDGVSRSASFVYANVEECIRYVEDLFYLLVDDSDPFVSIQFTFPCFPSVMYKISSFDTKIIRRTIRERLLATLVNWPEKTVV